MTVDAAIADKPQQMQPAVAVFGSVETIDDGSDLAHFVFFHCLIDPHDVLPDHTACSDIKMSDLGIAHQPLGKADGKRGSVKLGVALCRGRALGSKSVHNRSLGCCDSVAILRRGLGRYSPAIYHDY